jgi:hypothetical protein
LLPLKAARRGRRLKQDRHWQQRQQRPANRASREQLPSASKIHRSTGNDSADTKADKPSMGGFSGQFFGGGPIVGVASKSTKESIREFNKKNHYDQWQFIYDPSSDRGGLLNTPAQPPLQGSAGVPAGMGPGGPGHREHPLE